MGNNGVRHKASIRQQSTRDFFCQGVIFVLIGDKRASTSKRLLDWIYLCTASTTMTFVSKESDSSPHKSTSKVILQY